MKDNVLPDEIYEQESYSKKYLLISVVAIIFVIVLSIPWKSLFQIPSLSSLMGCPVQHSEITIKYFPPGPSMKSLNLPPQCTGLKQNIEIKDFALSFGGISFSPLGPVFNLSGNLESLPFSIRLAVGLGQINIGLYDEKISLSKLSAILKKHLNLPLDFSGTAKADLRFSITNNVLDEYQVHIQSQDLLLPQQNITLIQIPELPLKTLELKLQGKKAKASLDNLTIGGNSTLLLQTKGNILFDFYYFANSQLDLNVEIKLSQKINENFAILSTILGNKKVGEGNFKFQLKGTVGSPSI